MSGRSLKKQRERPAYLVNAGDIAFDPTLGMVVIPHGSAYIRATTWHDSIDRQREFIALERASLGDRPPVQQWVYTLVELAPRPDNTYNNKAISVAQPHSYGGTAADRHTGYVSEADLPHLGGLRFSQLADRARTEFGAPVACHARVLSGPHEQIELCLPEAPQLHALIDSALHRTKWPATTAVDQKGHRGAALSGASRSSADTLDVPTARAHQAAHLEAHAQQQLSTWRLRGLGAIPSGPVKIQQRSVFGKRRVYVVNEAGGRIGRIDKGTLFLNDESYRPAALEAAASAGLELFGSPVLTDECPHAVVEGGESRWSLNVLSDVLPMGWYEPDIRRLHIHAIAYRLPALTLLARLGVFPKETVWSAPPPEIYLALGNVRKPLKAMNVPAEIDPKFRRIWAHHSHLLPRDLARHSPLHFTAQEPDPDICSDTADSLFDTYGSVHYLDGLFGPHILDQKLKGKRPLPCRLCGQDALPCQRRGEIDAEWLAYCCICLRNAARGFFVDEGNDEPWEPLAVWALAELSAELGGAPSQAQVLRLPPTTSPQIVDRAMLVRMHVPRVNFDIRRDGPQKRAPYTWFDWLVKAGVVADGVKTSRGIMSVATDGHVCRSLLERHIDDFFTANKIHHEVEPYWPYDPELNPNGMRADWLLHDGTYVEAWGLPDEKAYAEKMRNKANLAAKHGIRFLGVSSKDLGQLNELFGPFLDTSAG